VDLVVEGSSPFTHPSIKGSRTRSSGALLFCTVRAIPLRDAPGMHDFLACWIAGAPPVGRVRAPGNESLEGEPPAGASRPDRRSGRAVCVAFECHAPGPGGTPGGRGEGRGGDLPFQCQGSGVMDSLVDLHLARFQKPPCLVSGGGLVTIGVNRSGQPAGRDSSTALPSPSAILADRMTPATC
jgi:hypothetical protein